MRHFCVPRFLLIDHPPVRGFVPGTWRFSLLPNDVIAYFPFGPAEKRDGCNPCRQNLMSACLLPPDGIRLSVRSSLPYSTSCILYGLGKNSVQLLKVGKLL